MWQYWAETQYGIRQETEREETLELPDARSDDLEILCPVCDVPMDIVKEVHNATCRICGFWLNWSGPFQNRCSNYRLDRLVGGVGENMSELAELLEGFPA